MSAVLSQLLLPSGPILLASPFDCRRLSPSGADLAMTNKLRSSTRPAHPTHPTHLLTPDKPMDDSNSSLEDSSSSLPCSPTSTPSPLSPPSPTPPPSLPSSTSPPPPALLAPRAHSAFLPSPSSSSVSSSDPTPLPTAAFLDPAQLSSLLHHSARSSSPSPPPILPTLPPSPAPNSSPSHSPSPSPSPSPTPLPLLFVPPYPDDSLPTRQLKFIYRVYHHVCDIYFAVDKDLDGLGETRKRTQTCAPGVAGAGGNGGGGGGRRDIPDTVSPGYGELARSGFDKVCHYLCEEAPEAVRMGPDCRFLDIGSGFGKCVLHAKVRGKVRESVGIEFIPVRHEKAAETLHYLRARFVPGLTDGRSAEAVAGEAELLALMNAIDLDGVSLVQGDICDERQHALLYRASHIYMFDVVFSDVTMAQILPLIERTNFALFACYHRPAYLVKMGCHQFVCIHKMAMKTTGKQSFTCYFYIKASAGTKVTRTREKQWRTEEIRKKIDSTASNHVQQEAEGQSKRKRRVKSHGWSYKKSSGHPHRRRPVADDNDDDEKEEEEESVDGEEEEEEEQASEEEAEEEERVQANAEVRVKAKVSHKSRGIRSAARSAAKRRTVIAAAMSSLLPSVLEPPRPRQLTNTAAQSLATDAFQAMVCKAVAARLVAEQERMDALEEKRAKRAERSMQLQLPAVSAAADVASTSPPPPPAPRPPSPLLPSPAASATAGPINFLADCERVLLEEATRMAEEEARAEGFALPLIERAPTIITNLPPPDTALNSEPPPSPEAPAASSPPAAPQRQPLTARAQLRLEVEQAKASAFHLLSLVLPHAVSAATEAIERGDRTAPHLILAAMETLDEEPLPLPSHALPSVQARKVEEAPAEEGIVVKEAANEQVSDARAVQSKSTKRKAETEEGGAQKKAASALMDAKELLLLGHSSNGWRPAQSPSPSVLEDEDDATATTDASLTPPSAVNMQPAGDVQPQMPAEMELEVNAKGEVTEEPAAASSPDTVR